MDIMEKHPTNMTEKEGWEYVRAKGIRGKATYVYVPNPIVPIPEVGGMTYAKGFPGIPDVDILNLDGSK